MANILGKKIPCLVSKDTAGGIRYYWQPSAALSKHGWKAISLGQDLVAAISAAEAQNEKVTSWREGGEKPREVAKIIRRATMDDMIDGYRKEIAERERQYLLPAVQRNPTLGEPLSPNTAKAYRTGLNIIEQWSTGVAIATITKERVIKLRNALMQPNDDGEIQHHRAHNTLRVLRQLFEHGIRRGLLSKDANPAVNFELATPPPRDAVWDEDGGRADIEAFARGAEAIGYPSLALAVEIAEYYGQRHADILKISRQHWKPVHLHDPTLMDALRGDDEELMGLTQRQGKTKKWVGVPIVRPLRTRIEEAFKRNLAMDPPQTVLLLDDKTGLPWTTRQFHRQFAKARDWAINPPAEARAKGAQPYPRLAELEFRDLRRTRVVRALEKNLEPGLIASITGHSIKTIEAMLEIYGPRTTRQAAIAVLAMHGRSEKAADHGEQAQTGSAA
ncbi:hypothetical protein [Sphingomonas oligoaromativorans]|uniref:hypothetical protein n=1 Tax=Sphingomonas oligoaromativorans TaxID=575322 RepID=UPI0014235B37|nr:hypothetical protein [Sphingomonas oligoaromativorans]NIJ34302.1 hypothetical protein [Sphingomonas oligoaromativorans]